jgi:hypothetical protein
MNFSNFDNTYVFSNQDKRSKIRSKKRTPDLPEFMLYQENDTKQSDAEIRDTMTKGIIYGVGGQPEDCETSPVTALFFSNDNVQRIQKMIRREVAMRTGNKFILDEDQDETDLLVAMRAVFFDMYGARFLPFKIKHQVKDLNRKVINYIMPDMIAAVEQSYGYIKEINSPLRPPNTPINVSSKGRRELPSITTIWTR